MSRLTRRAAEIQLVDRLRLCFEFASRDDSASRPTGEGMGIVYDCTNEIALRGCKSALWQMLRNISDPTFVKCLCLSLCAGPMKKKARRSAVASSPMAVPRSGSTQRSYARCPSEQTDLSCSSRCPPSGEKGGRGFPLDANAATNNYP